MIFRLVTMIFRGAATAEIKKTKIILMFFLMHENIDAFSKKIQPKVAKKLRFDLIFREAASAEIKKNKNMFNVLWANPRTILRYGQNTSHNLILWVIIMCTLGVGPYQDLSIKKTQIFLILLKVAVSQKILDNFYISNINIPKHYLEQKIWVSRIKQ